MNGAIAREKDRELQHLRDEMDMAMLIEHDAKSAAVLHSLHRIQVLQFKLQRVEAFNPTLFDARFGIQISLSAYTAILIANILLRNVLEGLI